MTKKTPTYTDVWNKLSDIDVSKHTKTIGTGNYKLSYLSWAWAWGVMMDNYPNTEYKFTEFDNGNDVRYYSDGTCAVECIISIGDLSRSMWLPVMDNRHKAVSSPNALQISNAKMRCLTKCLAMWGLGHYIYAGEDLPNTDTEPKKEYTGLTVPASDKQKSLITTLESKLEGVLKPNAYTIFDGLTKADASKAIDKLQDKIKEKEMELSYER